MTHKDEPWLRAVAEPGQEPSRRRKVGSGMGSTAQSVFDVLYEAGEPLDADTIITRTWERATSGARGYAMRAILAKRDRNRHWRQRSEGQSVALSDSDRESHEISAVEAWPLQIRKILGQRRWNKTLLVDEQGRYFPNPDKPPIAERVDGSSYRYSREAWLETTREARATGEVHTMTMEVERYLGGRSRDELLLVLEVLVDDLASFGKDKPRPVNPRTIRAQLRWLLERPTTDESRAWLLHELTRRIYETQ
jgi:hypothetical protein